ncbi:ATP-binding protein [Fulvivirga ulvae]|uniref:AlbA family DNA-binding domain-containing protein n=1 Tax=Fulvivirga ulvae TaxID=2904245 RepID=UPI001F491F87|nr:ATP-binding protein [Fulvivirga ulvae]UII34959.1 ATP-binding protein [Fulvivirga ulvae]
MEFNDIKRLVAGGESETVEFKRKAAHPDKIVKELVAFANTKGGYLLVGVNDDGSIPGLKFPEDDAYALDQAINKYCKPSLKVRQEIVPISEKRAVVLYHVSPGKKKPYYVITDFETKWGQAFVRIDDKSIKASKEVREILKRGNKNKGVKFNYGEKEKILIDYLDKNKSITLNEFKKLAHLTTYSASRTLILLVLANVLSIEPSDKDDLYSLKAI